MSATHQAWVGRCHYRQNDTDFETTVAVWANTRQEFDAILRTTLSETGGELIWSENTLPITGYLARHGHDTAIIALAKAVHQGRKVEFGKANGITTNTPETDYLIIEEIENVEPLNDQFGVADKKTVPDALYEPLFGQPAPTADEIAQYENAENVPPLKTYAILDAAKIDMLPERLLNAGLKHRCLFKGEAGENLADAAPWIVELAEDSDFTRSLFTAASSPDAFDAHWAREAGIILRVRGALDHVWRHCRKFNRVRDDQGEAFYFRYWEPRYTKAYFEAIRRQHDEIDAWFMLNTGERIDAILILASEYHALYALKPAPAFVPGATPRPAGLTVGQGILGAMQDHRAAEQIRTFTALLRRTFPDLCAAISDSDLEATVRGGIERVREFGFVQGEDVFRLLAWDLFHGGPFEASDPEGHLSTICRSNVSAQEKLGRLGARIQTLMV